MSPLLLASGGGLLEDLGINLVVLGTQVTIFVVTFVILAKILFGRVLSHMQQREGEMKTSGDAIARDRAEVERMTKEYEAHLAKIDKEGYDKTQAILKEAISAAQSSVAKAQADAKSEADRAVAEIAKEKREAMGQLKAEVTRLSLGLAEKVLGARLDPAVHGPVVQKFIQERSGS